MSSSSPTASAVRTTPAVPVEDQVLETPTEQPGPLKVGSHLLVAAHISSVFTSSAHVTTHAVPTSRRDIPLPTLPNNPSSPHDHASYSSVFHSDLTGHVLIRIIQCGLTVELISLSTSVPPVRFVFPAAVVPSPALVVHEDREIHLLAVTSVGSLYRLVLPPHQGDQLWNGPLERSWCREWCIKRLGGSQPQLVHVQNQTCVSIALNSGSYIRLDADGVDAGNDWSEVECRSSKWITSLLPVFHSSTAQPAEVISFASAPPPTDDTDIYTLSRDYVLRRWSVLKGCQALYDIASKGGSAVQHDKPAAIIEGCSPRLIQVYTSVLKTNGKTAASDDGVAKILLVCLPTPQSTTSGGIFQVRDLKTLDEKLSCAASPATTNCKLQDFLVVNDTLYALWEKQGQSRLEMRRFAKERFEGEWLAAVHGQATDLSKVLSDELLLQPGCLVDKFLQAILRPGVFSNLTLRSALQDYKEHYLSLPGNRAPALLSSHATLGEGIAAVVGCTVELTHDPHTGVAQWMQYWSALRRDWGGFVARSVEIERNARWPLALGYRDGSGQVVVIERERIVQCVGEDNQTFLHRQLSAYQPIQTDYVLLPLCWTLRAKLGNQLARKVENEALNILTQEIAFPLADIVVEASNKVFSRADVDEAIENWVNSQLPPASDLSSAVHKLLDLIGGLDASVKQEEDEVEMIIPPSTPEWTRAHITSFVTETIEARYDLCVALMVLLFFMGDDLRQYDPALLGEAFAAFRGVVTLRFLCRQNAGDPDGARPYVPTPAADDVVTRMSSLHMSGESSTHPTYSLVHELLSQSSLPSSIHAAAHYFLADIDILSTESAANASGPEVALCERLRLAGFREAARQLITWLPRSPAVCYVLAQLLLDMGRGDESSLLFKSVTGSFGPDSSLSDVDRHALKSVLPTGSHFKSEFEFYQHVAGLFRVVGITQYDVTFSQHAIAVASGMADTSEIWTNIIKGYSDLGSYEDAYSCLVASPHEHLKQQQVSHLVYKMCEDDALDRLLSMNFRGLVKEVEASLSFKARNADPRARTNYSQILYTWYIFRGDYRSAALAMYLRSRKLSEASTDISNLMTLAEQQAEALLLAINALSLLERKNAWIVAPLLAGMHPQKRQKFSCYIPEEKFTSGQRDVEVVTMCEIQQEYTHLTAMLALWRKDSLAVQSSDMVGQPLITVSKLSRAGLFDLAITTAHMLSVDMTELFQRLTVCCIKLSAASDPSMMEATASDWLLTDKVASWPGTTAERGWRYLRQSLERYDSQKLDYKYSKAVLDTLLLHDMQKSIPTWILQRIQENHPEYLIRAYLQYGLYDESLSLALRLVHESSNSWDRASAIRPFKTWLPYNLIDTVLKASEERSSTSINILRESLRSELSLHVNRLKKHSERLR